MIFQEKKVKNFLERDDHKRAEYEEKRESLSEKDRVYVDESGIKEYLYRE
ncbi:hypothetical protein AGMMS50296_7580 [Alphaproteobacteria bacterium]|nr:hypothetical protein AGMMS50296_7580 [Alphaproteobacteria bacterium]